MDEILIVGTGALATLFAARLSAAGVDVTMLGSWPEGLAVLHEKGARLEGIEQVYPVRATDDITDCIGAKFALVLVKAWQTERAATQLVDCLSDDGLALTLQNGLGNREILSQTLGFQRTVIGVTTTGATLLEPGLVRLGGEGMVTLEVHPRLAPLEGMLRRSGFAVEVVKDAQSLVWGKLVVNAAINPLTALLRVPNGELLERPEACSLMGTLAVEAAAVAQAMGVSLPFLDPKQASEEIARRTANNKSSMFQDVLRSASTEIDAINGAVIRLGEQLGVKTPCNRVIWSLVKSISE